MLYEDIVMLALAYTDRERTRSGIEARIDDFLSIVEARLNRVLSTDAMQKVTTIARVADATEYPLPIDYLKTRQLVIRNTLTGAKADLVYLSPEQQTNITKGCAPDNGYTIVNSNIVITPLAINNDLYLAYTAVVPPLTASASENWFSKMHPDCYIYGLAAEISVYVKDMDTYTVMYARYNDAINEISFLDAVAIPSGTALQVRVG